MKRITPLWAAGMFIIAAQLALVAGCESQQTTDGKTKSRYPQTSKPVIVDANHPPQSGAKIAKVYEDVAYGKTELRADGYHRHWDTVAGNWTPWHYRTNRHTWGDDPAPVAPRPAPAKPIKSNRAVGVFPGAAGPNDSEAGCCGPVVLEKMAPAEVAVGAEYTYTIKVTNTGSLAAKDVKVTDMPGEGLTIVKADPAGNGSWTFAELGPGESKTITVTAKAAKPGVVENCATVSFTPVICVATTVIEPALKLTKVAPAEVLLCDRIPIKLTVTNTGTGTARNVMIKDTLPAGLTTVDGGKSDVSINVGDLPSGESRSYTIVAKPGKTGTFDNKATASGAGGLKADASAKTVVRQPVLTIAKKGPEKQFIGRNVTYQITVKNTGDAGAKDTVVTDAIGAGATFVSASDGGAFAGGTVTWNLGMLAKGAEKTVTVTVKPAGKGEICNTATAKAYCAETVTAKACTNVMGIPAVLLEVIDITDPIEVGDEETYVITVTNQGSANDTNIKIVATLEDAQSHISNEGPTAGKAAGKTITFAPLPSLAPGAKATWKVKVKAEKAGDVRFKVTMTTDELTRPVEETEATNQYE